MYRDYSRRSAGAVGKHGGKAVALGKLAGAEESGPGTEPRTIMILVEWPSREAFDAFLGDPDLHPLRKDGIENYLWWTYEQLEDLKPLFRESRHDS